MVSPHRSMKAELIIPIDALRGKLREDGYYFRMYKGVQIVQRCPDRSKLLSMQALIEEKYIKNNIK